MAKQKHMTIEERQSIESMLTSGSSLTQIAKALGRDISTIRHEIKKHRHESHYASQGRRYNDCALGFRCSFRGSCSGCNTKGACNRCNTCNDLCPHFVPSQCKRRDSKPYCCNGCSRIHTCLFKKYFYKPSEAQKEYESLLSESRQGLNITPEELKKLDDLVNRLVREQGQSVNAAIENNPDVFNICSKTLYSYINSGIFSTRNIDLARKVRLASRKNSVHHKVDRNCTIGRTYEDFLEYMKNNPETDVVEFDSVEGPKGTAVLLTMYFRSCSLQLSFIRPSNNARSVQDVIDELYDTLGHDAFTMLFHVILADNGTEFSNPSAIENFTVTDESTGEVTSTERTKVFYCHSSAPYEKGACERNHEFIRYFVPKGKSFESYSQSDITKMMNHINSYRRDNKKMNPKVPASRFIALYGEEIADKLSITVIDPNSVILNGSLFNKK